MFWKKSNDTDLTELKSQNKEMQRLLEKAVKTMRISFGAIETNQVVDKDIHGLLKSNWMELKSFLEYPRKCTECNIYPADYPSLMCVGCESYKDHQI